MNAATHFCPGCGLGIIAVPMPIDGRYTIAEAAVLNRMKTSSLERWLQTHKRDAGLGPRKYQGPVNREKRMLSSADVRYISSIVLRSHRHREHFRLPELAQLAEAFTPKPVPKRIKPKKAIQPVDASWRDRVEP